MKQIQGLAWALLLVLVAGSLTTALVVTLTSTAEGAILPAHSDATSAPTVPSATTPLPAEGRPMSVVAPTNSAQPETHALIPVSGERPHVATQAGLNLSTNWSGEIASGSGASFTGVEGEWVVPSVQASAGDEYSSTWIGIDGVDASSLIQTGTGQDSGPDGGYARVG